ncbi:phosphate ABC transporter, permease protein [Oceanicola granulosus HTCC2516]|uniref:Phosphate transport system permease protein n=1 Tax=Oceanicola granulosus (strain ATCC BAA-861 / DSM 15982 / KCTC 12143 / HTCC2516) TaxID=314256 RepID=Q2CE55_OCEGH|nr:phosphate ABC transporter permease subunit PstC [Oceanicola granulosus]EAR51005.1 phosphate ABC transporter, permease protein [Oceanicola granulosus HTCC2516]
MSALVIVLIVCAIAAAGFVLGRARALASAGGDIRGLHSLPSYYGLNVALAALLPALLLLALWSIAQPLLVERSVAAMLPDGVDSALVMSDVRRVADGLALAVAQGALSPQEVAALDADATDLRATLGDVGVALGSAVTPEILDAARTHRAMSATGDLWRAIVVIAAALAGTAVGWSVTNSALRARNLVERVALALLAFAASVAILTTLGIVLSLIFNTLEFFRLYPASEFFLGTTWSPSFGGGSELGILPLLWGTLYISFIALLVAVPIGLFAAIYLSEYASPGVRGIVKPLLEMLAGIPTIVYGLFALLTVGPLLVELFGNGGPLGLGWMDGGTAVMTAGLVMGIMLIPFVSSLSDDIINAVPQALRDGSLGLGATRSETVRQVILPAALPGIVGAVLLAASRAIGETMIVVLGAGAAARLSMNPFDAMTTVTAKIVSQLTGDADFSSPEALVAFALGMTLFVITLVLNVFALWIVRTYREQYD